MACPTQVFTGITQERFNDLVQEAAASGITITGNTGQASEKGITMRWKFDPPTETLELQCMDKPLLVPCSVVDGQIQKLIVSLPPTTKPPAPKPPVPKPPVPKPPVPKPPVPKPPVPKPPVPKPPVPKPPVPKPPVPTPATGTSGIARSAFVPPPPPPVGEFAQRAVTTLARSPSLGIVAVVGLVVLGTVGVVAMSGGGNEC